MGQDRRHDRRWPARAERLKRQAPFLNAPAVIAAARDNVHDLAQSCPTSPTHGVHSRDRTRCATGCASRTPRSLPARQGLDKGIIARNRMAIPSSRACTSIRKIADGKSARFCPVSTVSESDVPSPAEM